MIMNKRTFIAIKITPNNTLIQAIDDIKSHFVDKKIKWTSIDDFHITLKFIGKTNPEKITQIIKKLKNTLENFTQFEISINKFGYFSCKKSTRVIWFGLTEKKTLKKLKKKVLCTLENLDFGSSDYNFSPHLTIARIKSPINLENHKF